MFPNQKPQQKDCFKKKKKSREKVCEMSATTTDLELTQVGSF